MDCLPLTQSLLSETREELAKADQKANLLLAALGVAAAALVGAFASAKISPIEFDPAAQWIFWTGCGTASLALVFLGMAVYPYPGTGKQGRMYYFGDIQANDGLTESEILRLIQMANHAERNIQQFSVLARSVTRKYKRIRFGMFFSGAALALLAAGTLLGVAH
ncbi:Pycsar system effector family protein [Streptomyces sp. NPDC016675]|uniref:Pycsar system effector family protein n=1 Tax=Streptomyces sp. NPDC016675 TaxID=3364970 RepID=UPI0036F7E205